LWLTVFALLGLAVLLGLGGWQVQRLFWKQDLIDTVTAQIAEPPVTLPARVDDTAPWQYRRVSVRGVFLHDKEIHLIAHDSHGRLGYDIITPLVRNDAAGTVLVNRGWVPTDNLDPATRSEGQLAGAVTINGLVRLPWRQGWFVPDNDPQANVWFWGDAAGMAAAAGVDAPSLFVDADATANPGGLPLGGQTRVSFRNDHLQYALTWFALALCLAVVYLLYSRKRVEPGAPS
jgi:surfeit locus 1 family protein